jgi:large subunit ribosomal protein L6
MSRIGKQPINVPAGVTVEVTNGAVIVKGPKGELTQQLSDRVTVVVADGVVTVNRKDDEKYSRADHGLYRSLIGNMVQGASEGFTKQLEVNGVGFKVAMNGKGLKMALGFSHDVEYQPPEGVELSVEQNLITVKGASKQLVGQTAADIRSLKKPEPYKGKGIKYSDETIIKKAGKAAGGA